MTLIKALFVFILLSSFSLITEATGRIQKVAFFTSIDLWDSGSPLFRDRYRHLIPKLEQQFRNEIAPDYDVLVKHGANQFDVWQTLHDPSVAGIIWYSHTNRGVIEDRSGFNILPVFQETHENFRFMGIIGCKSKEAIGTLKKRGYLKNPQLTIKTYDKEFYANYTTVLLKNYLDELKAVLKTSNFQQPIYSLVVEQNMKTLSITRYLPTSGQIHPPLRIEDPKGKVFGVFPGGQGGDHQQIKIRIPLNYKSDLAVKVGSSASIINGNLSEDDLSLGDFEIVSQYPQDRWELYKNSQGKPYGLTNRTFINTAK